MWNKKSNDALELDIAEINCQLSRIDTALANYSRNISDLDIRLREYGRTIERLHNLRQGGLEDSRRLRLLMEFLGVELVEKEATMRFKEDDNE